jgi:hypothetical protein
MSIEDRYTPDELLVIHGLPSLIGAAVAYSSDNGPIGTAREMMATAKAVVRGRNRFDDNELVASVLPTIEDQDEAEAEGKSVREALMARLQEKEVNSREAMADQAVEDAAMVSAMLDERASPEEAAGYREWSMDVAVASAKAAREGGFLGIGGERIGEGEKATIARVAEALGATQPDID